MISTSFTGNSSCFVPISHPTREQACLSLISADELAYKDSAAGNAWGAEGILRRVKNTSTGSGPNSKPNNEPVPIPGPRPPVLPRPQNSNPPAITPQASTTQKLEILTDFYQIIVAGYSATVTCLQSTPPDPNTLGIGTGLCIFGQAYAEATNPVVDLGNVFIDLLKH